MNLHFVTIGETEQNGNKYLIQKANVTKNRQFHIRWNQAYKQDLEAKSLGCELPFNIRRFLALTTKRIDGQVHKFCIRKILKSTELEEYPKLHPIKMDYVPRNSTGLLPFQLRAFEHLCNVLINEGAAIDASDTGLGKTYVAGALCRELYFRPIVLCKKIAIPNWLDVLSMFDVKPFGVINWEYMIRDNIDFYKSGRWTVPPKTLIIFDEAHYANHEGTKNNRMYEAASHLPTLSITATAGDKPVRLAPLLSVLGAMTKEQFEQWRKRRGEFENDYSVREAVSESDDMRALNRLIFPRFGYRLRYTDSDVRSAFPEAIYNTMLVTLSKEREKIQNKAHDKLLEKIAKLKEEKNGQEFQAAKLVEELRYRQLAEILKVPSFVEVSKEYIKDGFSVIIFVNYLDTLKELSKRLKTDSVIYGDQDKNESKKRNQVIEDFQENRTNIIIAMAKAAGTSISLHDTKGEHQRISLISPGYNSIELKQILGRTYRAEAKTPPIMTMVFAAKTVEEKVAHTVNRKLDNLAAINDGDLMTYDTFNLGREQ